jgi:hypothetical protein
MSLKLARLICAAVGTLPLHSVVLNFWLCQLSFNIFPSKTRRRLFLSLIPLHLFRDQHYLSSVSNYYLAMSTVFTVCI